MFHKNSRIFIILVVILLIFSNFVLSQDNTDKRKSYDNYNKRESPTYTTTTTTTTKRSISTDGDGPVFESLPDFLNSIKFYFKEPQNSTVINPSSVINIRWQCDDVNFDTKYTIKLVLQSLVSLMELNFY